MATAVWYVVDIVKGQGVIETHTFAIEAEAHEDARKASRRKGVSRVTITRTAATVVGIYRKGQSS